MLKIISKVENLSEKIVQEQKVMKKHRVNRQAVVHSTISNGQKELQKKSNSFRKKYGRYF